MKEEICIEYPAQGATYRHEQYGVYSYGEYPQGSVLEGQQRRTSLGLFDSLEEAKAEFPGATYIDGSQFREPHIPVNPPEWFDPAAIGESWNGEDY